VKLLLPFCSILWKGKDAGWVAVAGSMGRGCWAAGCKGWQAAGETG